MSQKNRNHLVYVAALVPGKKYLEWTYQIMERSSKPPSNHPTYHLTQKRIWPLCFSETSASHLLHDRRPGWLQWFCSLQSSLGRTENICSRLSSISCSNSPGNSFQPGCCSPLCNYKTLETTQVNPVKVLWVFLALLKHEVGIYTDSVKNILSNL
jgi:hypothetical protein